MGNRGTTPSWDEEQTAKHGLFAHLSFTTRHLRASHLTEQRELVAKHIGNVVALLPSPSEETIARASAAIPRVAVVLTMLEIAIPNWKQSIASDVYDDWMRRANQSDAPVFYKLSDDEKQPFIDIVDIVVRAVESAPDQKATPK